MVRASPQARRPPPLPPSWIFPHTSCSAVAPAPGLRLASFMPIPQRQLAPGVPLNPPQQQRQQRQNQGHGWMWWGEEASESAEETGGKCGGRSGGRRVWGLR